MSKRIKEYVEVGEPRSLDLLIERLIQIRDELPHGAEAQMRMRGDDVFGRRLTISYFRDQTIEEMECDARYADAYVEAKERELARLQEELAQLAPPQRQRLRAVA